MWEGGCLQIDKQSLEIERLFVENEGLRGNVKQANEFSARWEAQVSSELPLMIVTSPGLCHFTGGSCNRLAY